MCPNPPGATKPPTTNIGMVIGIFVVVIVLVLAIASVLVYCFWKRKRYSEDYAQPNIELSDMPRPEGSPIYEEPANNARPSRNPLQNRELPPVPDMEGIYEEPAKYAQLDNSKRVPIDDNYQGLNAHNTKRDRSFNEDVKENDGPQELEYITVI